MAGTRILDKETVMQRIGNDEDLWRELLEIFLLDAPLKMAALSRALTERNAKLLVRQAHSLKGAAANIGADYFRQLASELELAGDHGNWSQSQILMERLIRAWRELSPQLQTRC